MKKSNRPDLKRLFKSAGEGIMKSPFLSIMIVDKNLNIIWHNERFASDFKMGKDVKGKKCWQVTGSSRPHPGCATQRSLAHGSTTGGFMDYGNRNIFYVTMPLKDGCALQLHVILPKKASGRSKTIRKKL